MAADILPTKSGTVIVAVHEPFDLANTEHINRANEIEINMNDLGLLAVIDPSVYAALAGYDSSEHLK